MKNSKSNLFCVLFAIAFAIICYGTYLCVHLYHHVMAIASAIF